jgi:heptosyltransferase II
MIPLNDYKPEKIVIRMPNWIGDLIMTTPILTDVRRAYPSAHITAMCRTPISDLLKEDLDIDELFCFSKASGFGRRSEKRNVIEKLQNGNYDLGILLTHWFSSAWLFWRGHVKRRLGYEGNGRSLLLTDKIPLPAKVKEQHLVLTYKALLEPLGIPLSNTKPRLFITDKELEEARTLLKRRGVSPKAKLVGINPGAAYGSAKCWLPERFRQVAEKLLQQGNIQVVFFGDQATAPLVKEICQGLPPSVINFAGVTTLRQLASLIKLCDALLTNDSGPMHVAAALGTPLVALYGSTSEIVTGPYKTGTVIHKHVDCSPCYKRVCPIDFRCMKRIETDEVYEALMQTLNQKNYAKKALEKNRA